MTLAKKSSKHWYNITVYFTDGEERKFNCIDWCKLDRNSNTLIIADDRKRDYIKYTEVRQTRIVLER